MDVTQYKRVPMDDIPQDYRLGYAGNRFYAKITEEVSIRDDQDVTAWALISLDRNVVATLDHMISKLMQVPDNKIVAAKMKNGIVYFVQPNNVSSKYLGNLNFW